MAREQLTTLTEQMFYILLALKEPMYGLEISEYISNMTSGRVELPPGTLYALLNRFEKERYITMVSMLSKRKVYQISELGEKLLADEYARIGMMISDYDKRSL